MVALAVTAASPPGPVKPDAWTSARATRVFWPISTLPPKPKALATANRQAAPGLVTLASGSGSNAARASASAAPFRTSDARATTTAKAFRSAAPATLMYPTGSLVVAVAARSASPARAASRSASASARASGAASAHSSYPPFIVATTMASTFALPPIPTMPFASVISAVASVRSEIPPRVMLPTAEAVAAASAAASPGFSLTPSAATVATASRAASPMVPWTSSASGVATALTEAAASCVTPALSWGRTSTASWWASWAALKVAVWAGASALSLCSLVVTWSEPNVALLCCACRIVSAGGVVIVRGRLPAVAQRTASSASASPDQSAGSNAVVLAGLPVVYSLRVQPASGSVWWTRRKMVSAVWP